MEIGAAIVPAAGRGTRMHPFTQVVPKELLPLSPRPAIGYIADEVARAGIGRLILIIAPGKESILDYVTWWQRHENPTNTPLEIIPVMQAEPRGLGHAILQAQPHLRGTHSAILLPDDLIDHPISALEQIRAIAHFYQAPAIALQQVPWHDTVRYGIVAGKTIDVRCQLIKKLVEKPTHNPPSNYAIVGRYIVPHTLFDILAECNQTGTESNELQLTPALAKLCLQSPLYGYACLGTRYDIGTPQGWATAVAHYTHEGVHSP